MGIETQYRIWKRYSGGFIPQFKPWYSFEWRDIGHAYTTYEQAVDALDFYRGGRKWIIEAPKTPEPPEPPDLSAWANPVGGGSGGGARGKPYFKEKAGDSIRLYHLDGSPAYPTKKETHLINNEKPERITMFNNARIEELEKQVSKLQLAVDCLRGNHTLVMDFDQAKREQYLRCASCCRSQEELKKEK